MNQEPDTDRLDSLRSKPTPDASADPETPEPTPPPVYLVYQGQTGADGNWQPPHEGLACFQIGGDFVTIWPGLNILAAARWAGAEDNERVAELLANHQIVMTDERLAGFSSLGARNALARAPLASPDAIAWFYELESGRPVTANPRERRQDKLVEYLELAVKRHRKRLAPDFSGLDKLAAAKAGIVVPAAPPS